MRLWNNAAPRFHWDLTEAPGDKEALGSSGVSVCRRIFCSLLGCWGTIKPEAASQVSGCVTSGGHIWGDALSALALLLLLAGRGAAGSPGWGESSGMCQERFSTSSTGARCAGKASQPAEKAREQSKRHNKRTKSKRASLNRTCKGPDQLKPG